MQVLTLDFHNTLANCDPWFDLEVRDLPWAVIEHLELDVAISAKDSIDRAYRQLRLDVIASGAEIDAYDSVARLFDQFEVAAPRGVIRTTIDELMHLNMQDMVPVPGSVETVWRLKAEGVRLGVVSSAVHHLTLDWTLGRLGIASCFDAVVTSASSGYYKSSPAIYESALRALGGIAGSSVHVGDSLKWDVSIAQKAGMHAVWLKTGRHGVFANGPIDTVPTLTLDNMVNAGPVLLDLLERIRTPANA